MKNFVDSIYAAESFEGAGSQKARIDIISEWTPTGKRLVREAMSPYRVFGVKKFDMPKAYSAVDSAPDYFFHLLDNLCNRDLTGNAARDAVTETLALYTERTAEILKRILMKDLKAGFSADTVNKIYAGAKNAPEKSLLVPSYKLMLAEKIEKGFPVGLFDSPKQLDAKYDGQRYNGFVQFNSRGLNIIERARSGKWLDHVEGMFADDLERMRKEYGEDFVIDGELMAADFTQTMNAKGKKNKNAKDALRIIAYDIVPVSNWNMRVCDKPQRQRSDELRKLIQTVSPQRIQLVNSRIVSNEEEAFEFYEQCVSDGYEGCVFKDLDALYEWDRSDSWLKWKPTDTFDLKIVGFYSGRKGTRLENSLGGVLVEGEDENGNQIAGKCGGGFSDELRDEIFNHQHKYLGRTIEIVADPRITTSNGKHNVRWGRFKKFRPDKD